MAKKDKIEVRHEAKSLGEHAGDGLLAFATAGATLLVQSDRPRYVATQGGQEIARFKTEKEAKAFQRLGNKNRQ